MKRCLLLLNCVFASSKTESMEEGDRKDYICPRDEGSLSVPESTKEGMREKRKTRIFFKDVGFPLVSEKSMNRGQ